MITNILKNHTRFVRVFLLITLSILLFLAMMVGYITQELKKLTDRIYPQVYIDNVSVGRKTKAEVISLFKEREQKLLNTKIQIFYHKEIIGTFSAQLLGLHTNTDEIFEKAYLVGRTPHTSSRIYQRITTLFGLDKFQFSTQVQYLNSVISENVERYKESYDKPAKNALFKFEKGRVVSFRKEEKGNALLTEALLRDIDQSIRSLKYKQKNYVITLKEQPVEPEVLLAKANGFGIEELIGQGVSNYSHSIPGRIHNVILAASKFNGVLIPKNSELSFNETIGDISAQTGYQPAYIIKGGKTVLGDGGGVCQVSTTFFRAALNAGLPILEQHPHAYRVSYYENDSKPGLDATVFAPSVDLKIQNNTPASILIQTEIDEEKMILTFKLYGKKDDRNIELSVPVLFDVAPPPDPLYQDDPTLKRGIVKQVDFPAWGGKATFTYKVSRKNEVLFDKKFFSSSKPWQAVFLVGTQD